MGLRRRARLWPGAPLVLLLGHGHALAFALFGPALAGHGLQDGEENDDPDEDELFHGRVQPPWVESVVSDPGPAMAFRMAVSAWTLRYFT